MKSSTPNSERAESLTKSIGEYEDVASRENRRLAREGAELAVKGLNKLAAQKRAEREARDRGPSGPPPSIK